LFQSVDRSCDYNIVEVSLKQIPIFGFVLLCLSTIPGIAGIPSSSLPDRHEDYSHAYYLFLAGVPKGCEDCYVPLLITKEPLERLTNTKGNAACVLIITYERDSIWHDDGFVSVLPGDIEAGPRTVRLNARKYRYQEISSREVVKLLQNPMGTIPISRPILQNATSPGPSLQELISAFKQRN
jgi:hypothetical protein